MMCCEISNKILRTDTVLNQMEEIVKRGGANASFRATAEKALLGAIVMTRYNNKTYRIDEIAWDKHPDDEFDYKNGEKLSYVKYYADKYNKSIRDPKQPLLVSMPRVSLITQLRAAAKCLNEQVSLISFCFSRLVTRGPG